ncbi:hypothetical protein D3C76_1386440 [compost metagenome]
MHIAQPNPALLLLLRSADKLHNLCKTLRCNTGTIIIDANLYHIIDQTNIYIDMDRSLFILQSMHNGVLHQRLNDQRRNVYFLCSGIDMNLKGKPIPVAEFLYLQVGANHLELGLEGRFATPDFKALAHQFAEQSDDIRNLGLPFDMSFHANGLQGVKQKVGINLTRHHF